MIESEVKVFDSKINLHPIDAQNIDAVRNSQFDATEITSHFEEVKAPAVTAFVKQRKIKRHQSAGIF